MSSSRAPSNISKMGLMEVVGPMTLPRHTSAQIILTLHK